MEVAGGTMVVVGGAVEVAVGVVIGVVVLDPYLLFYGNLQTSPSSREFTKLLTHRL